MRRLFLIILLLFVFSVSWGFKNSKQVLFYVRQPPSVKELGSLGSGVVLANQSARVLVHFTNSFSQTIKLTFMCDKPVIDCKIGCKTASRAELASLFATEQFMKSSKKSGNIKIESLVSPGQTINALIEFESKEKTKFECNIGGTRILRDAKIIKTDFYELVKSIPLHASMSTVINLNSTAIQRLENGGYGITQKIIIKSNNEKAMMVDFIVYPKMSQIQFPYKINGVVNLTPEIAIAKRYKLYSRTIMPNEQITFELMPIIGYRYPVKIIIIGSATVV